MAVKVVLAIIRKLQIDIGIQLPEKYKENFDVSSEGPVIFPAPATRGVHRIGFMGGFTGGLGGVKPLLESL